MKTLREKHAAEVGQARTALVAMFPSAQLQASKNTVLQLWAHLQYPEDLRAFLDAAARIEAASLDQALWEKVDADRRRWVGAPGASPLNHTWFLKRLARLDALSGDRHSDEGPDRLEAGAPPAGLDSLLELQNQPVPSGGLDGACGRLGGRGSQDRGAVADPTPHDGGGDLVVPGHLEPAVQ